MNFIPLDFFEFNQKMNRGQMADLITRIMKSEEGVLDDYLGDLKNITIEYEDLLDQNCCSN